MRRLRIRYFVVSLLFVDFSYIGEAFTYHVRATSLAIFDYTAYSKMRIFWPIVSDIGIRHGLLSARVIVIKQAGPNRL